MVEGEIINSLDGKKAFKSRKIGFQNRVRTRKSKITLKLSYDLPIPYEIQNNPGRMRTTSLSQRG